jgi:ketosteroid isomerase-like protein
VELVGRALEHFVTTGEPPWDSFDEQIEVHDHDTPDQGEYRGHEGVGRWLTEWGAAWGEWSIEPQEYIDAGECVVAVLLMKATGQGSGLALERQDAIVFRVRDGKTARLDYYNSREQALQAVGLGK